MVSADAPIGILAVSRSRQYMVTLGRGGVPWQLQPLAGICAVELGKRRASAMSQRRGQLPRDGRGLHVYPQPAFVHCACVHGRALITREKTRGYLDATRRLRILTNRIFGGRPNPIMRKTNRRSGGYQAKRTSQVPAQTGRELASHTQSYQK